MKKKLVIITRSMFAGGAERVIAQLANYITNRKLNCMIIMLDNEKILYDLDEKIELISIGKKSENKFFDKVLRYGVLRKLIKIHDVDVVLSMPEDIGVYVILALLGKRVPVYVSERNNPWIMPDVKITRILRRLMYPFAEGIIFQTETAKSYFSKGIQKKGLVLANPIDKNRIPIQYNGERKKVIVGAGRLCDQKNFPLLINAFARISNDYPEYKLQIYGEGNRRTKLEQLVIELKLKTRVEFMGRKKNLLELINNASLFVLSSNYEGMPNVLLEAMCMGMPVISTDCPSGGPRELIKNGVNGLLVPVNDVSAMEHAIRIMLNFDFANRMAHEAKRLREKVTDTAIFDNWIEYLFK